ncbi:hypothetical protein BCR39DRAFT_28368 [Naematelia encephala]|uniref:Uncharacterized protein n=1 Tax=Naematelia encephala TaxID=71784 RepID=A0A1Y2BLQ5_9TREE|nr:hypothetical protein BCR39DRAFT_28368 [Naematelia encephala]
MSFRDQSSSVSSLLEQLRATTTPSTVIPQSTVPSKRQLDDLLSSLNQPAPAPAPASSTQSAFLGARRNLIEPFGPVSNQPQPPPRQFYSTPSDDVERENAVAGPSSLRSSEKLSRGKKHPRDRRDEEGYAEMSFAKALPILTELLSEEEFKRELRRIKAEQNALERRLWAKQEKLKADHEKQVQSERDLAKISNRPLAPDKPAEWTRALKVLLAEMHRDRVLPSFDGLALRHRQRLEELGVPGLGGGAQLDEKARERVKRIMDVLEASLED